MVPPDTVTGRWLTCARERMPIGAYLLLVAGLSSSGAALGGTFALGPWTVLTLALLVVFAALRVADELKDFDTDSVAHPERPLPRGLVSRREAVYVWRGLLLALLALALLLGAIATLAAAAALTCAGLYVVLMARELFLGSALRSRPLLYAALHQALLVFLCAAATLTFEPASLAQRTTWAWTATVLGAFFTYEIARKLDPLAHPALRTYLHVHGRGVTSLAVLTLSLVAAAGAKGLGLLSVLAPLEALVVLGVVGLAWRPDAHRVVAALATLSLACHIWAGAIARVRPAW